MHITIVSDMSRLVLTRKVNEKVTIQKGGEAIATVTIGRIDRNQVRIVFEADPEVEITRHSREKKSADQY